MTGEAGPGDTGASATAQQSEGVWRLLEEQLIINEGFHSL